MCGAREEMRSVYKPVREEERRRGETRGDERLVKRGL